MRGVDRRGGEGWRGRSEAERERGLGSRWSAVSEGNELSEREYYYTWKEEGEGDGVVGKGEGEGRRREREMGW